MSTIRTSYVIFAVGLVLQMSSMAHAQWLSGWVPYDGNYYRVTTEQSWSAAEAQGIASGGHLIKIDDAAENLFVVNDLLPYASSADGFWIGLIQPSGSMEPGGGWVWSNGDPVTFSNWNVAEPNNDTFHAGHENAGNLFGIGSGGGAPGEWNDLNGDYWALPGIIEVPEPASTIVATGIITLLMIRRRR